MNSTEELENRKKQYRRLHISFLDLISARKFASYILENELHGNKSADVVLNGLSMALVVSYARPFLNNKDSESFPATSKPRLNVNRILNETEKKHHEELINLRNTELAHSDSGSHETKQSLRTPSVGAERISITLQRRVGMALTKGQTELTLLIVKKLIEEVMKLKQELRAVLPDAENF